MTNHYKWSLTELDDMMLWEREIYVAMLKQFVEEENQRLKENERKYK